MLTTQFYFLTSLPLVQEMRGRKMMISKIDDKSNTTVTSTSDTNNHAASNFQPTKKPKLQMKRKSAGKNQDVANAEVQVLQSI